MSQILENYLLSSRKQFSYYKKIGEQAIDQISDDELFIVTNDESNSIAIIIQHLAGNMLSRWTDVLQTDGEKPSRNRDLEFVPMINNRKELIELWEKGWQCLFDALTSFHPNDLQQIIYIRNEGHTLLEAINRQLSHYPYHVGQIVLLAKQLKGDGWNSLSIPKNKSAFFNTEHFKKEKDIRHFTDDESK